MDLLSLIIIIATKSNLPPAVVEGLLRAESNYCQFQRNAKSSSVGCFHMLKANYNPANYLVVKKNLNATNYLMPKNVINSQQGNFWLPSFDLKSHITNGKGPTIDDNLIEATEVAIHLKYLNLRHSGNLNLIVRSWRFGVTGALRYANPTRYELHVLDFSKNKYFRLRNR